jgi:hypothetical protein
MKCEQCGEVNPAEIHTCTPNYVDRRQWKYDPMTGNRLAQPEPVGWIYEDDEGRMMFSQMPQNPPLWEPVFKAKREKNT